VDEFKKLPDCEVVAVCDENPAKLKGYEGLETFTCYDAFIEKAKLDIVAVITPGPVHAPQSLRAMEAGVHVISETPCVYTVDEARAIVRLAEKTGLKYMLTEDYIFMGWVQAWERLIQEGKLGEIVFAEGEYTHDCRDIFFMDRAGAYVPYRDRKKHEGLQLSWRATALPPLKYCSHTLGPLLHLMDDRCVTASGLHTGCRTVPQSGAVDVAVGIFKTKKGNVVRLTNGFSIAHPFAYFVGLYGTKGTVKMMRIGGATVKAWFEDEHAGKGWTDIPTPWAEREDGRRWLSVVVEGFVESVRRDTKPPVDVYESMDYTLPGICAHDSADQNGRVLDVPDLRPQ
jgi:predicted dehydrogenase